MLIRKHSPTRHLKLSLHFHPDLVILNLVIIFPLHTEISFVTCYLITVTTAQDWLESYDIF